MGRDAMLESDAAPGISIAEWLAMPEDEPGELVDGQLVEEEVPDYVHEFLVILLAQALGGWVLPRGGVMGGSEAKLTLGPKRGRKPDLTVYLPGSRRPPRRGAIRVPPDIAVEVVSPTPRDGRRDRVEKMAEYAAFGIRYYWIVDPELRSLEIAELGDDGRYTHAVGATEGTVDNIPGCAGLTVDLDAIWVALDQLPAEEDEAAEPVSE